MKVGTWPWHRKSMSSLGEGGKSAEGPPLAASSARPRYAMGKASERVLRVNLPPLAASVFTLSFPAEVESRLRRSCPLDDDDDEKSLDNISQLAHRGKPPVARGVRAIF